MQPFEYALANGFDAFEWFPDRTVGGLGWDEDDLNPGQRREIRRAAAVRGVRLSVHAPWRANPLDPESRPRLLAGVELANELGAALLNIHLSSAEGPVAYVQSIIWLLDRLADVGIELAIENTPETTPQDFNRLFTSLHDLDSVPTEHVGMCFDLGHANLCPPTRNDFLAYFDQLDAGVPIIHAHLHENWGDYDSHLPLFTGPAGANPAGVRGLLVRLRERHYAGSIILEQWPHPPSLLDTARLRLNEFLRQLADEPVSTSLRQA